MKIGDYLKEAGKAALAAGIAYLASNYVSVDLAEPYKQILALVAVALWARFAAVRRAA